MRKLDLNTKLENLAIFTPNELQKLSKLGLSKVSDLLFYLPFRYEDKSSLTPISQIKIGTKVLTEGKIAAANYAKNRSRHFIAKLDDASASASVYLRFINYYPSLIAKLTAGAQVRAYGEIRQGFYGLEIIHPELTFTSKISKKLPEIEATLTPVYSTSASIKQFFIKNSVRKVLNFCLNFNNFIEVLPQELIDKYSLPPIMQALQEAHFPTPDISKEALLAFRTPAQIRLIFEELLARQLSLLHKRQQMQTYKGQPFKFNESIQAKFLQSLSFTPTGAQMRSFAEILADMGKVPMLRLLQGDVGSGKTLVAALAILQVIVNGFQAVLMSPTEILASQHYQTFKNWFEPLGFKVVFLVGKQRVKQKRELLAQIATGACDLIIGTHALIQKSVEFKNLALSVIDEQHRFGVKQREELFLNISHKEEFFPHQLIMTATPIPRSLAMTIYADLELSVLDEMPKNRKPIQTLVMPMHKRGELIQRLIGAKQKNMQIFWVCALVSESETINSKAAEETYADLSQELPNFNIGLVHGKQKNQDKEKNMTAFRTGALDLLVATTVIEVGVDIPKAGVMIIDNAERFGLSQLHQLRGRVGRGKDEAYCILLYKAPLSPISANRLAVIRNNLNGFKIAEADLHLRGEGDMLGKLQAGKMIFRVADLARDLEFFDLLQTSAQNMFVDGFNLGLLHRWQTQILNS